MGDIDGWSGGSLALTIEVKDRRVTADDVEATFSDFLGNQSVWPDATVIAVADTIDEGAVQVLENHGIQALDRDSMLRSVSLWDLRKQQLAVREFTYYVERVERHNRLADRLRTFLNTHNLQL